MKDYNQKNGCSLSYLCKNTLICFLVVTDSGLYEGNHEAQRDYILWFNYW